VADVFTKMLIKAAMHNQITGLMHGMIPTGIVSMQYADDTLLFLKNNLDNVVNLKWILSCFEQMSGMRINFHKCDLIAINVEEEEAQTIAQSLCCRLGEFPMKYLGVPLHYKSLGKKISNQSLIKFLKKLVVGEADYLIMQQNWSWSEVCWLASLCTCLVSLNSLNGL
jgi:hypothetical protein